MSEIKWWLKGAKLRTESAPSKKEKTKYEDGQCLVKIQKAV